MTYYNLEKSVSDLKIVSEAKALREENDKLRQTLNEERKTSATKIVELQALVSSKDMEIQELRSYNVVYNKNEYSRREFTSLVKEHVKKEYIKQIQKGVERKFQKDLPALISSEIQKFPDKCSPATYSLIEAQARKRRDELLKSSVWPPWFNKWVNQKIFSDVNKQLDKKFEGRVATSAQQRLENLRNVAWPQYVNDVITPYLQNSLTSQLLILNTTILVTCHRCGETMSVTITPIEISQLLRSGMIQLTCIYCTGFFRPRIKITLGGLILILLQGHRGEPRARIVGKYKVIGFKKLEENISESNRESKS